MSMATGRPAVAQAIEIRVDDIAQLFHTLDPFPFREKDLDTDAEEYIVSSARELAPDQPPKIIVHLPAAQASTSGARDIGAALARHFDHRAQPSSLELKHLFRLGRRALAIGLGVPVPFRHRSSNRRGEPCPAPARPGHRGELHHFRLGRELAADRSLPVRLVADRPAAQAL